MTLLASYRRWWAAVFLVFLLLPAVGLFTADMPAPVRTRVAPEARWWVNASARLDPYVNEAFGFRGVLLKGNKFYRRVLHSQQSKSALIGKNRQMFLLEDANLEQALGVQVDRGAMAEFAKLMGEIQERATKIGAELVVTSPPAGDTVNFDNLPDWALAQKTSPTNYDLAAEAMQDQGIRFADLRAPLIAARSDGPDYRLTDSHWNYRGSLIGYNEIMKTAGRPELTVTEEESLGPLVPDGPGDLARLYGDPSITQDMNYLPKNVLDWQKHVTPIPGMFAPPGPKELFIPYAYATDHPGPRVLIFGDSFSQFYWPPFLVNRVSALAWTHHKQCHADLSIIERFKPDLIIYAPTQRHLPCKDQK